MALNLEKIRISTEKLPDYVPDPPQLGGFFYRGHLNLVVSKPGVGKTWLMLGVSRSVYREGMKTVIFNGEGGLPLLLNRCSAVGLRVPVDFLTIYDSTSVNLSLSTREGWENFCQCCIAEEPDVVYVDSFLAFFGEDESNMKEMNGVMTRLRRLARKLDCAVVVNHHLRKQQQISKGQPSLDDVIGSSVLGRLAGAVFLLSPEGDLVKISCLKSWFEKTADCYLSVKKSVEGGVNLVITSMRKVSNSTHQRILDVLSECRGCPLTVEQIATSTQLNNRTLRRVMKAMYEQQLVERVTLTSQPLTYGYQVE